MKQLPLFHRPFGAKRILEIGGGHDPYEGVTHAVDKYPDDNSQRADRIHLPRGVDFRQGELEAIPFDSEPKFDFIYVSHVVEHVSDPAKAVSEINRVALKGYIETPSPLREQIACPFPYDPASDFHTYYCWTSSQRENTLHLIRKSGERVGEFCGCENGRLAQFIFSLRRKEIDIDPLLPREPKTTRLYFKAPLRFETHASFAEACQSGSCAYGSAQEVLRWSSFPYRLVSRRLKLLDRILSQHRDELRA